MLTVWPIINRGCLLTIVIIYVFSRVSVSPLRPMYQYSSSSSATFAFSSPSLHFSTVLLALFFYPIHYIGFVHVQYLAYRPTTRPCIVHLDCLLSDLLWILPAFRVDCVSCAALLTHAALRPRCVVSDLLLVFFFSAFWADLACFHFYLSHIFIIP